MVSLIVVFWIFVIMFGIIGAMRGWAKELLVTFSVILALFLITLVDKYAGFVPRLVKPTTPTITADALGALQYAFWIRVAIVGFLAYFGYQTSIIQRFIKSERLIREHFQDLLLGLFLGLVNGFLIMGTVLYYLHETNYLISTLITVPQGDAAIAMERLWTFLPPRLLGEPGIYFAVGVAFVFVLVVFI